MKYAKIEDPTLRKTVTWEPWSYLLDLLDIFESNREVVIGKARQLGISWLVCGYALWMTLFHENVRVLIISKGQEEAWELVSHCRFIFNCLPEFLKRETGHFRKDIIEFVSNNSNIRALASTENAGTGYTASLVIRDELDKHPYAKQNFAAIGPTVDAGGQMIDLSTRNKDVTSEDSHFLGRYLQAKSGAINAKKVFLGWRFRPVREQDKTLDDWFEENVRKKYPLYQIEQEYPETEEEFLSEAETTRFFEQEGINFIRRDCYNPIETDFNGIVKIWEYPVEGRKYAMFCDPSDGSDPHAIGIIDVLAKRIVFVSHGRTKLEKCAEIFDKYGRLYNNAFNEFELNGAGGLRFGQLIDDLGTPNRRVSKVSKDRKNKHGWWTSDKLKGLMLDGLEEAVRNKRLRIHYKEIPNEMEYMTRKQGETPSVPRSKGDDLIMMLGGLLQITRESHIGNYYVPQPSMCEGF